VVLLLLLLLLLLLWKGRELTMSGDLPPSNFWFVPTAAAAEGYMEGKVNRAFSLARFGAVQAGVHRPAPPRFPPSARRGRVAIAPSSSCIDWTQRDEAKRLWQSMEGPAHVHETPLVLLKSEEEEEEEEFQVPAPGGLVVIGP
jgi:hypothetical protein